MNELEANINYPKKLNEGCQYFFTTIVRAKGMVTGKCALETLVCKNKLNLTPE